MGAIRSDPMTALPSPLHTEAWETLPRSSRRGVRRGGSTLVSESGCRGACCTLRYGVVARRALYYRSRPGVRCLVLGPEGGAGTPLID